MPPTIVKLIDIRNSRNPVSAEIIEDVDAAFLTATDEFWNDFRNTRSDTDHWNWAGKLRQELEKDSLFKNFALIYKGEPQGLMFVNYGRDHTSRFPQFANKLLVYIRYIEVAPWNNPAYVSIPRFSQVGKALYRAAIQFSLNLGFSGRGALHSLPKSEGFYEQKCNMTRFDADPEMEKLVYFESSPEQSIEFLRNTERTLQ